MITKIVSGFQDGADFGGILAGQICGVQTGGYIPKGFKTESGPKPHYIKYGAIETKTSNYDERTKKNVAISNCTIIFASNVNSPGTKLTIKWASKLKRPYIVINPNKPPDVSKVIQWLRDRIHVTVNIAGHRESVHRDIQDFVCFYMCKIIVGLR